MVYKRIRALKKKEKRANALRESVNTGQEILPDQQAVIEQAVHIPAIVEELEKLQIQMEGLATPPPVSETKEEAAKNKKRRQKK